MVAQSKMFQSRNSKNIEKLHMNKTIVDVPKLDGLLQKLRSETVDLMEQGDTLTYQMHKLYKGVHHLVNENMLDEEDSYNESLEQDSIIESQLIMSGQGHIDTYSRADISGQGYIDPYSRADISGQGHIDPYSRTDISGQGHIDPYSRADISGQGYIDPYSRADISGQGYIDPYSRAASSDNCTAVQNKTIQNRLKMMSKPLCGSRYPSVQPPSNLSLPANQLKQTLQPISNHISSQFYPYFDPEMTRDDSCYDTVVPADSPVTVSSGYSSDKDHSLNHSDLQQDGNHNDLHGNHPVEDSFSFCDNEVAEIHKNHCNDTEEDKVCAKLCNSAETRLTDDNYVIEPDQLYSNKCDLYPDEVLSYNKDRCNASPIQCSFKPIVQENTGNVLSSNGYNHTSIIKQTSFKPIVQEKLPQQRQYKTGCLKRRSDSFSMVRQTMKDIVKDLKDNKIQKNNKNKVSRHHSLREKHSQGYLCFAESNNPDVIPPPVTCLPGFHPAWYGSVDRLPLSSSTGQFTISQNSAFRPYKNTSLNNLQRSQSISMKDVSCHAFSVSSQSSEETKDKTTFVSSLKKEPVYASLNDTFRSKTSTLSSDSGQGSSESCDGTSPTPHCKSNVRPSSMYNISNREPVYEHIMNGTIKLNPSPSEIPPKLPARNRCSKYKQPYRRECISKRSAPRKNTLKLEDIVKPNDIVHSNGKHMYTVSDILQSVDRLNQDIPTHCHTSPRYASVNNNNSTKLRRSMSHSSVRNPLCHSFTSCDNISQHEQPYKKFKKLVSPIRATRNDCNMALTKRLCSVDENTSELSLGLIVIPTKYGLQFKSNVDDLHTSVSRSMSQLTLDDSSYDNKPVINWVSRNTGNEIFC